MLQSTFWTINLCLHCPVHFLMLFGVVANARKDKHNKRAIANGWPAPVAGFMGFYSHLTTCTQLLTIVYLAVSIHGGYPHARGTLQAINATFASIVGSLWVFFLNVNPTMSGPPPPWTMFHRELFPRKDEEANRIVKRILWPSLQDPPLLIFFLFLQVQHTIGPLAPWVELFAWPEAPALPLSKEVPLQLLCCAAWISWSIGLCWHVRGVPPYPVLGAAWRDGVAVWLPLYGGIILVCGLGFVCLRQLIAQGLWLSAVCSSSPTCRRVYPHY